MSSLIDRVKTVWWWISDADWRKRYTHNNRRIRLFRAGQRRAMKRLLKTSGSRVLAGPFVGMAFSPATRPKAYCAQVLLGTYELEIHGAIDEICRVPYSLIVDIGADEGYYACGLKRRLPYVEVVAFESVRAKHAAMRRLMSANDVEGITIHGACDSDALQRQLRNEPRPLVFCDIDGAEVELLAPDAVPALTAADILVETHDGLRPGITDQLIQRFSSTHHVEVFPERPRTVADAPAGTPLSDAELMLAMDEFRGFRQAWLWMVAKAATVDSAA